MQIVNVIHRLSSKQQASSATSASVYLAIASLFPSTRLQYAYRPRATFSNFKLHASSSSLASTSRIGAKEEMLTLIDSIGLPMSVLPGDEKERRDIDSLVQRLIAEGKCDMSGQSGDWQLIHASNGTVVTRQVLPQVLVSLSNLPGFGIDNIKQSLDVTDGEIKAGNSAVFGLGPLGSWEIAIQGQWTPTDECGVYDVGFNGVAVTSVGFLGLDLPQCLQAKVYIPFNTPATYWKTLYADDDVRISCGKTGNMFVLRRMRN